MLIQQEYNETQQMAVEKYGDNRTVLNILFHPQEPEIFRCAYYRHGRSNKQCMLPGLMVEIMVLIAKRGNFKLNFTMDYRETYDYDDSCQRLNNDSIDIFGFTVRPTYRLLQNCDVSASLFQIRPYLFVKAEDTIGQGWWNLVTIYDRYTWTAMLLFVLLQSSFVYIVYYSEHRLNFRGPVKGYDVVWKVGRLQLFQPELFHFKLRSGACSISWFALFQGSLMLGIYSSCCLSALIKQPNFNELRKDTYVYDQLRKGKRKLVSWGPLYKFRERIFNRTEQGFLELQRAVGDHGLQDHSTVEGLLNSFTVDNNFVYDYKTSGIGLMLMEFCETMVADIRYPSNSRHLLMSRNNPHRMIIDDVIRNNQPKIKSIYDSYVDRKMQHKCSQFKIGNPLQLNYYYGLLIVCGIGIFIATVIFFFESLHYKIHHQKPFK